MHDTRSESSGQLAPGMPPEFTTMFPPVHKCDGDRSEAAGCASTTIADYFVLCTDSRALKNGDIMSISDMDFAEQQLRGRQR